MNSDNDKTLSVKPAGSAHNNIWEHETHSYNRMHYRLSLILEEICCVAPQTLFELGCSTGVLHDELLKCYGNSINYFGTDISESAVRIINDPNVVCADLNREIPFVNMTFDFIVGSGLVEYIEDVRSLLSEVSSRLPCGGHFVMSYFNMKHLWRRCKILFGKTPYRHSMWRNDYSYDQLRKIICESGFEISKERTISAGLLPASGIDVAPFSFLNRLDTLGILPEALIHSKVFVLCKL